VKLNLLVYNIVMEDNFFKEIIKQLPFAAVFLLIAWGLIWFLYIVVQPYV